MQITAPFTHQMFMASSLTFMIVYIWAKRNPGMQIRYGARVSRAHVHTYAHAPTHARTPPCSLLGLVAFTAPYLPWVLLIFSMLLGQDVTADALGIAVGHAYYFLADVYPALAAARGWRMTSLLATPYLLHVAFGTHRRPAEDQFEIVNDVPVDAAPPPEAPQPEPPAADAAHAQDAAR